jgi:hypothetical protein
VGVLLPIDDHGIQSGNIKIGCDNFGNYIEGEGTSSIAMIGYGNYVSIANNKVGGGTVKFSSTYLQFNTQLIQLGTQNYDNVAISPIQSWNHIGTHVTLQAGDGGGGLVSGYDGGNLILKGGFGWLEGNGGNVYIYGGADSGDSVSTTGKIYIGTGSAGTNPLAEADSSIAHVLMYDTSTGEVTYAAV